MQIEPARRVNNVSEYYFSTKLKEIDEMKAAGKDVINLGIGSPDLPPSDATIETLCKEAHKPNVHGYQSYIGIPELRNGFAEWYKKWYGVELNPNTEIQPLIGSKEGILHISLAFLNPGDGVLVPNPGYPTYTSVSHLCEAKVIPYDLDEKHQWQPDFDALEKMNLDGVKLMWTNYPNMPTGANASVELFEKLVAFGKKHNIIICNDNPYSFILNDRKLSILSVEGAKDICIEMNSMSKSHNMAGWRVGMAVGNATAVAALLQTKSNIDSGIFLAVQDAAAAALTGDQSWIPARNTEYQRRRDAMYDVLVNYLGLEVALPCASLYLWPRVPVGHTSAELADRILTATGVSLTPGSAFGAHGEGYLRISLGQTTDRFMIAVERLRQLKHGEVFY